MKEDKLSFEQAYERLENAVSALNDEATPLEEALKSYKEGRKYYEYCMGILENARQTIEIYDKKSGELCKEQQL
ncbi:MAG: exodeoxyribonuclease VII small subunit [Anaerovoracaceae bacterium]